MLNQIGLPSLDNPYSTTPGKLSERYGELSIVRQPYLTRGRAAALATIPTLLPPQGANQATNYPKPYQSEGAHALNTLAAKLTQAILPVSAPFFELAVDPLTIKKLAQQPGAKATWDEALSLVEQSVTDDIASTDARTKLNEAMKMTIQAGNALLDTRGKKWRV